MKKLATILGTAALFAATVLPVLGVGNSCGNSTTGPYSTNYCTVNNTSNVTVNNVNDAKITNNMTVRSNTGNNSASYNTLGGTIQTGNATLNTTVSTVANVNTTSINGGPVGPNNTGLNEITGPFSDNRIEIDNGQIVDIYNSNTATVNNTINATSNAGDNRADYNTGPAVVTTGNASLGVSLFNHINDNLTGVSIGGGNSSALSNGGSGNSGSNSTTGPYSTNYVTIRNLADVVVNNVNDLILRNRVDTLANAGGNSASYNTLGGSVAAGNASSQVGVDNQGNYNTTTVEIAMGGFSNDGSNSVTGPGIGGPAIDNNVELVNDQNVVVDNWNNKCESHNADRLGGWGHWWGHDKECDPRFLGVTNYDNDEANTGDNEADYNTGPGGVGSGLASLVKNILTHLNDSLTVIQL